MQDVKTAQCNWLKEVGQRKQRGLLILKVCLSEHHNIISKLMIMSKIKTHYKENNQDSENHLHQNETHFKKQTKKVLELLQKGIVLTSRSAMIDYNIGDVHRRIGELREENKIEGIVDEWVREEGKSKYKKWYMPEFVKNNGNVYKQGVKASTDFSKEIIKSTKKIKPQVHNPLFDNLPINQP